MSEFKSLVKEIEGAYQRLGHSMGWRLLYGPRATLAPHSRLAFVGLDPGGHQYYPPAPSVEEGNAFRAAIEPWGPHGGESPLQSQIRVLYEALAGRLGATRSWEALMDETLAANLCPFRCPPRGWKALPNRDATIEFSRHLWWAHLRRRPAARRRLLRQGARRPSR